MPLYVESDFRWKFMCKFMESVKGKRNKLYCRKKIGRKLIAFLLVFFVDNNIVFFFSVQMSVNADSPANRLKSYKNKALDSQELRRRREEEGIQLRKQKRDEQVNNISSDGCCPGLLISNTCNEKHKHVCLSGSHENLMTTSFTTLANENTLIQLVVYL